jgi:cytoskeleton protein RodZ
VFDIGASLAAARETRGYSLADAERLTNVRVKYLSALERGNFDALPGRTYARAFLRTYASALGLEADRFVAAFEEMVPEPEDEAIVVGTPKRRRIMRPTYLGVLIAIAVVVAVAAWGTSPHNTRTLSSPPIAAAAVAPVTHPKTHVAAVKRIVRSVPARVHGRPAALVIRATRGNCWLQVRQGSASGAVVYEGMLRFGTTMSFAAQALWVRFGAPANVDAARGTKSVAGVVGSAPVNVTA